MFFYRQAQVEDIPELIKIDNKIMLDLWFKKQRRFLEPLDRERVKEKFGRGIAIIVAYNNSKDIIGYIMLEEMEKEEKLRFKTSFNNFHFEKALKICRLVVLPGWQEHGLGMALLEEAKRYAKQKGYKQISGMLHPEDLKAQKAVLFLWEEGASKKKIRFSPKFILNMRGYRSIRQRFLIEI